MWKNKTAKRRNKLRNGFVIVIVASAITAFSTSLTAGNYGDIYGAHPWHHAMGGAVTSIVTDSSAVFYNVAGLGMLSEGDRLMVLIEAAAKKKSAGKNPNKDANKNEPGVKAADANAAKNAKDKSAKQSPSRSWSDWRKYTGALGGVYRDYFSNALDHKPADRPEKIVHELSLHYNYVRPELSTTAPSNQDIEGIRDDYAVLSLAMNLGSIFDFGRVVRFGLTFMLPATGNLITINDLNPTVHRYLQHGVSNQRPIIMAGLGVEVWKDIISVGVGFSTSVDGKGALLLKDVPISPDQVIPDQQAIIEVKAKFQPNYGLMLKYGKLRGGVTYKRESFIGISDLDARAQTQLLGIQLDFDLAVLDLFTPRVWAFGLGYQFSDKLMAAVDVNRELWSSFSSYRSDLENFTGNAPLSRTKRTYVEDFYLKDVTVTRVGVEYAFYDWFKLRGGYTKRPSPLPVNNGGINWMDADRTYFMAGVKYVLMPGHFSFLSRLKHPIVFDFTIERQNLKSRALLKISPTTRQPHYYTVGGGVWHTGFSMTFYY